MLEAKQATADGDIGRLMMMWKQWSIMVQGMKGLTHYSNYLPCVVHLLTKTLPEEVSKVILSSLLVFPTGCPGHAIPKDTYLEIQKFLLKFFYNNSVRTYSLF